MITIYETGSFHHEPGKLINFSDEGEKDFTPSKNNDKFKYKE